jgi:hypothetical protein
VNIDELVRSGRPDSSAGWAGGVEGRRVLDEVVATATAPAERGRLVVDGPAARRPALRRLVLGGAVPVAAAVAVGAVVLTVQSGGSAPGTAERATDPAVVATGSAPQNARALLLVAAERTASGAATSGRYWVRSLEDAGRPVKVGPATRPYYVLQRFSLTQWDAMKPGDESVLITRDLGAAPMTADDKAAWEADGSPAQWRRGAEVIKAGAGEESVGPARPRPQEKKAPDATLLPYLLAGHPMTVAALAKLPTDPAALKQRLAKQVGTNEIFEANDHTLFQAGVDLVFDLPVSSQVRAAAYRMLADIKGVTSLGAMTDGRGRSGMAVGFARKGDGGNWTQTRLIVDPQTGQALAQESWDLGAGKSPAARGTQLSRRLLVSASFTDDTPPRVSDATR